jgi:hypothetical protein
VRDFMDDHGLRNKDTSCSAEWNHWVLTHTSMPPRMTASIGCIGENFIQLIKELIRE